MKKAAAFLALVLCMTLMPQVFASDYMNTAVSYLVAKHGVDENQIELFEGGIIELRHIGESLWFAKYSVNTGESSSVRTRPAPVPPADGRELEGSVEPVSPEYYGGIYGMMYIRVKTGAVLEMEEAERYFAEDYRLAAAEWERLQKEAGKLDVNLFLRLKSAAAHETLLVVIIPAFVETQAIKDQMESLKAKYPDYIYEIDEIDPRWWASPYDAPPYHRPETSGWRGEASFPSTGASQEQPTVTILPLPLPALDTETWDGDPYRQDYTTFRDELRAIMEQGYTEQQSAIESVLADMGVAYSRPEYGFLLYAELSVSQIDAIAVLPEVATIYEEVPFRMDADVAPSHTPRTLFLSKDAARTPGEAAELDLENAPAFSPFRCGYLLGLLLIPVAAISSLRLWRRIT